MNRVDALIKKYGFCNWQAQELIHEIENLEVVNKALQQALVAVKQYEPPRLTKSIRLAGWYVCYQGQEAFVVWCEDDLAEHKATKHAVIEPMYFLEDRDADND